MRVDGAQLGHEGTQLVHGHLVELDAVHACGREHPGAQYVDARGGLIMPGLINLHHRAGHTLARGLLPLSLIHI